jgi:hypothetical protein
MVRWITVEIAMIKVKPQPPTCPAAPGQKKVLRFYGSAAEAIGYIRSSH